MRRPLIPFLIALLGVAAVAWITTFYLPVLGLASSALLFLLPVLYAAAKAGTGPGLVAALAGAGAYNFFLLPPRFTWRIHGLDNVISVFVLVAVAVVTSRLATRLKAREAEALERARMSGELAELSNILGGIPASAAFDNGKSLVASRYGDIRLIEESDITGDDAAFSSLDLSAAAWALHNGDLTGHGTEVMSAAEWTFLPLAAKNRRDHAIVALARPMDGVSRSSAELGHLAQMFLLLGQARDRDALESERRDREALAASDQLRRNLLAALAHDFRTPLTVISGRLELIAQRDPDTREALAAAQRLDRMMTDILGAARIEAGTLAPVLESVDLVDAVDAALDGLAILPGIQINRAIAANLPFVSADPVLLHHVLSNLIDNALRYAAGSITIGGRCEGATVVITVTDDGPGVPEVDQQRIFDRFVRLEGSDRTRGSGLGLAIVKGFADAMGMTVSIKDSPTTGACFALAMPVVRKHRA